MNLSEVQATIDTAAQAIATKPTTSWPSLVTYLLEALEKQIALQDHQTILDHRHAQRWMLKKITETIVIRLETGGW